MAYCSVTDVQNAVGGAKRLRELSDWDRNNTPDTSVIDAVIAEADAWIDSYLSKRYSVPIASPVPVLIQTVSARETVFILKTNRSASTELDQVLHEERAKMLEDIAAGRVTLGVANQPTKSTLIRDRAYSRLSKEMMRSKYWGFS